MEQQQIQNVIEKAIELLSSVNQNNTNQFCTIPPELQKKIDEAGILQNVKLDPGLDKIREALPFIKAVEKSGDFPKFDYYCFVPSPDLLGGRCRLFGVNGGRKPIVVFEDFPKEIKIDDGSAKSRIEYAFLLPYQ